MIADAKPINTCCDRCKDICYDIDSQTILDAIYAAKVFLSDNSIKKNNFLKQGYIKGVLCKDEELDLTQNIEILEKHLELNRIDDFQKCLCDNEISQLVDNILGIANISCCTSSDRADLITDSTGYDAWVVKNPDAVVYESWEASFLGICTKFSLSEMFAEQNMTILYQLSVANITNKCDLITAISIQNEVREEMQVNFEVGEIKDCIIDYDILVSKTNCDLKLDTYVTLINCGVKAEVISKLVECGFKIEANAKKQSCDIFIDAITKITLCDYKFSLDSKNINCELASDILGVEFCK